jgi:hypothetical protein
LRNVSLKLIRALGIEGGCNVQLALDPDSFQYYISICFSRYGIHHFIKRKPDCDFRRKLCDRVTRRFWLPILHYRSESAGEPLICPSFKSDGLPDRKACGENVPSLRFADSNLSNGQRGILETT